MRPATPKSWRSAPRWSPSPLRPVRRKEARLSRGGRWVRGEARCVPGLLRGVRPIRKSQVAVSLGVARWQHPRTGVPAKRGGRRRRAIASVMVANIVAVLLAVRPPQPRPTAVAVRPLEQNKNVTYKTKQKRDVHVIDLSDPATHRQHKGLVPCQNEDLLSTLAAPRWCTLPAPARASWIG